MLSNRKTEYRERGLTLMEVLFALLIAGVFLMLALGLFINQWRGARALQNRLEAHYSVLTAGKTLSDAVRMSEQVTWEGGRLKVLPLPDKATSQPALDSYFLDDLDGDGHKDLYWRHAEVSQPVASHLLSWECKEVEPGLWKIVLLAEAGGQRAAWQTFIRRRVTGLVP